MSSDAAAAPLFCFGLIADIQHADKDTVSFDGRPQRYRESRAKLQAALSDFASRSAAGGNSSTTAAPAAAANATQQQQPQLQCVVTLGDIVDGYKDSSDAAAKTAADLQLVAGMFDQALPALLPVHHTLGNHCLTAGRDALLKALHMPASSYYSVALGSGWRLVVLDTTEMSLHSGYPEDSPQMQQAREWAAAHPIEQHPNAVPWNGGCTKEQLAWLTQQLADAQQQQEQVIVACHHPIAPGSSPDEYLAWGNDQLLAVLCAPGTPVRCVLSGHYHPGGYAQHESGVHFVVLEGVLEAPADSNAYAVVEVRPGSLTIRGSGVASSRVLSWL